MLHLVQGRALQAGEQEARLETVEGLAALPLPRKAARPCPRGDRVRRLEAGQPFREADLVHGLPGGGDGARSAPPEAAVPRRRERAALERPSSWSHGKKAFNVTNIGCPVGTALNWFRAMGVTREFDTNAGRKSLARWTLKLNVPYAA